MIKNSVKQMEGYTLSEYLLVLNPHEELRTKILEIRQDFHKSYKTSSPLHSKPYITLCIFKQYEMMGEKLFKRLNVLAMAQQPMKIELKDYGCNPSHTIFINVTSKVPIQKLVKEIRSLTQQMMKTDSENKPHFIMEPQIIIARKLLPWQYEKGWLEYSHKNFTGRFIADGMLLLKRKTGEMNYQVLQSLPFQNIAVMNTQGELFN